MPTDLRALLERLEAADGPSRELDAELWCWANGYEFVEWTTRWGCKLRYEPGQKVERRDAGDIGHYTHSLDAAMALRRHMLPDWGMVICTPPTGGCSVDLWPPGQKQAGVATRTDNRVALALCEGIVRAKLQEAEGAGSQGAA